MLLLVGSWPFAFLPPLPVNSAPVWLVFGFVSLIALRLRLCFSQRGSIGGEAPGHRRGGVTSEREAAE
jgi:hypothetical protein